MCFTFSPLVSNTLAECVADVNIIEEKLYGIHNLQLGWLFMVTPFQKQNIGYKNIALPYSYSATPLEKLSVLYTFSNFDFPI